MGKIETNKTVEIYALIDPRDGRVRYIGKANNAEARFKAHLREKRRVTPVYCWIGKLRKLGLTPALNVISVCSACDWQNHERAAIAEARATSDGLLNVADGGDEPYCPTKVRADNGRKNAALRVSTELKAKVYKLKQIMGKHLKDGCVSEASKAKLRIAARKRPDLFGEYASL